VRQRLAISPKTFVVAFAGRLSPVKAPGDLLDAWVLFSRQYADTRLLFVGDGELAQALQAQVAQNGLAEQVQFLGQVDDISDYLLVADAFVLPSLSEAMPNALLEAMAVGLPVIASAVGGILDVVEHGRNGLLFTPGDIDALAACLFEIAQSPELREKLGANARQTIIDEYDLEQMTDRYLALYHELTA
jgi:glycosyltransferase involved in cell wall biosynthesis